MQSRQRTAVRIRPRSTSARADKTHRIAVFTAVDGTLLDSRTFEAGASRATIARLLTAGIPVIPMSVMTIEELAPIPADLGLQTAVVVEAGGAIALEGRRLGRRTVRSAGRGVSERRRYERVHCDAGWRERSARLLKQAHRIQF
jgi:hypothetical protein